MDNLHQIFRSIQGERGQWYFIYHRYIWVRVRGSPGTVNLRCQERFCPARAKFHILDRVIDVDEDDVHQHRPPLEDLD